LLAANSQIPARFLARAVAAADLPVRVHPVDSARQVLAIADPLMGKAASPSIVGVCQLFPAMGA
jgi:hypothetical protein